MIDASTRKPLKVEGGSDVGPSLMVPYDQLDKVREVLDRNQVRYWVGEQVISIDDGPEIAFMEFYRSESADRIQALLDSVS